MASWRLAAQLPSAAFPSVSQLLMSLLLPTVAGVLRRRSPAKSAEPASPSSQSCGSTHSDAASHAHMPNAASPSPSPPSRRGTAASAADAASARRGGSRSSATRPGTTPGAPEPHVPARGTLRAAFASPLRSDRGGAEGAWSLAPTERLLDTPASAGADRAKCAPAPDEEDAEWRECVLALLALPEPDHARAPWPVSARAGAAATPHGAAPSSRELREAIAAKVARMQARLHEPASERNASAVSTGAAGAGVAASPSPSGIDNVRTAAREDVDRALREHGSLEAEVELLRAQLSDAQLRLKLRSGAVDSRMRDKVGKLELEMASLRAELGGTAVELTEASAAASAALEAQREAERQRIEAVAEAADVARRLASLEGQLRAERESRVAAENLLASASSASHSAAQEAKESALAAAEHCARAAAGEDSLAALRGRLSDAEARNRELESSTAIAKEASANAATLHSQEATAHRASKASLLAAENEMRALKRRAEGAEAKLMAAEGEIRKAKGDAAARDRELGRAKEQAAEAEARAEYLRAGAAKERESRAALIEEAKAQVARRATGQVLRLVVVAPTVRVQVPPDGDALERPRLPVAKLRAVLREEILPPFVRIFGRQETATSAAVEVREPWLNSLVEDLERGIEAQLRETFAGVSTTRTVPSP